MVFLASNVVGIVPVVPGNVGVFQLAVAIALRAGLRRRLATGITFGIGLQVIEVALGAGLGFMFLSLEGLSFGEVRRGIASAEQEEMRSRHRRCRSPRCTARRSSCDALLPSRSARNRGREEDVALEGRRGAGGEPPAIEPQAYAPVGLRRAELGREGDGPILHAQVERGATATDAGSRSAKLVTSCTGQPPVSAGSR